MKIEYGTSNKGTKYLLLDGYMMHSKYNPEREAEKFVKQHYKPHYITILFGYGLGYIVDEFVKQMKYDEIFIVIDPLLENGLELAEHHKKHNSHFFNENGIKNLRQILGSVVLNSETTIDVVCAPNYKNLFPENLLELLKKVKEIQRSNLINENTLFRFAEEWQENVYNNMYYLKQDDTLKQLEKKYNAPIVVAAGGPSLNKQIPTLKNYRDKVILIAAGSTVNSLLKHNITPDYIISIDGGIANYHHFKNKKIEDSTLIYMLLNHYGIRESFENGLIFNSFLEKNLTDYLNKQFNIEVPNLIGGSTVAHYAFTTAKYIVNNGQIALIGQDLAYTDFQTHASGNTHEEHVTDDFLKRRNAFQVPGYNGDFVWTDDVFLGMQRTFEEMMKFYPSEIPIFNCTEGGTEIEGFKKETFLSFCENYAKNPVHKIQVEQVLVENEELVKKLTEDKRRYDKLLEYLKKNIDIVQKQENFKSHKQLKRLDKNDKVIKKLIKELPIENIVTPIILAINKGFLEKENETEEEKIQRTMNQSKLLYEQLIKVIRQSNDWNDSLIARLEK